MAKQVINIMVKHVT